MHATQRLIVFNRAALTSAGGWIHIVPKGELTNAEAGIVQVLDEAALEAILAALEKDRQRLGDKWPGLYAGREHFIYDSDQDSAALAWFKDFQKRGDGIWAKADGLTPDGASALKNGQYKYTSFVADPSNLQPVGDEVTSRGAGEHSSRRALQNALPGCRVMKTVGDEVTSRGPNPGMTSGEHSSRRALQDALPRYRVMKIETVGFTNYANGKELLTPITNRTDAGGATIFAGAGAPAANQPNTKKPMNRIATKLGLAADAGADDILEAVSRIMNRADITPDALAILQAGHESLAEQNLALLGEQVDSLLAEHGVRDEKVVNRLRPVLAGLKNRAERVATLGDFGFKAAGERSQSAATRVLNRGTGAATVADKSAGAPMDRDRAQKITNRAQALMRETPHLQLATAFHMAAQE